MLKYSFIILIKMVAPMAQLKNLLNPEQI